MQKQLKFLISLIDQAKSFIKKHTSDHEYFNFIYKAKFIKKYNNNSKF